jgi:Ni,Fe-hydrogenase III large subunit
MLDGLLAHPVVPGAATVAQPPRPLGVGRVECPRGATLAAVALEGGRIARLRLRTGSYANWPALAHAAAGNLLPDFPLINKSFELCYACVDR